MQERAEAPIAPSSYYYRRRLSLAEHLPAVGVAIGAGLAAFYVARLFLERTPLEPSPRIARPAGALEPALERAHPRGSRGVRPAG
jgi:hypothetical protein